MTRLRWQNTSVFLSTADPFHILYLKGCLMGFPLPSVSSLELPPPCDTPFTNGPGNEDAAREAARHRAL